MFIIRDITKLEDWYNVTSAEIIQVGGGGLYKHVYDSSISKLLHGVYPEYL